MIYEPILDVNQKVTSRAYLNCSVGKHFHQSIELIYCHEGKLKVTCGADEYEIEKDEIAFFPSYFPHTVKCLKESISTTFIIPYSYFKPFIDGKNYLLFGKLADKEFNKTIERYIDDADIAMDKQPNLLLQGFVNVILGKISEHYPTEEKAGIKPELMMNIIDYINENSKEKLTLETLANHFGYSKYYFSRLFNKIFNCTLNFYINQVRKNKVLSERTGDKKITDVILDNGFGTVSTFYRTKFNKLEE